MTTMPPHLTNLDAELSCLAHILLFPANIDFFDKLESTYFTFELPKKIYKEMRKTRKDERLLDRINLNITNEEAIQCISKSSLSATFYSALDRIITLYIARKAFEMCVTVTDYTQKYEAGKELFDKMQETIELHKKLLIEENKVEKVQTVLEKWLKEKDTIWADKTRKPFFISSISGLDKICFMENQLTTVVARTKSGKTTMLCQIALDALNQDKPVLFITLEVAKTSILDKLLAIEAQINPYLTQNYGREDVFLSPSNQTKLTNALIKFNSFNLQMIDGSNVTINDIQNIIKKFSVENNGGIVIIDQLQFIRAGKMFDSRVYEYDYIMRELKQYALSSHTSMFLAHQMNREIERSSDRFPTSSDVKDSGRVEEISDHLILFAKSAKENCEDRLCRIISRHWAGSTVVLDWDKNLAKFI